MWFRFSNGNNVGSRKLQTMTFKFLHLLFDRICAQVTSTFNSVRLVTKPHDFTIIATTKMPPHARTHEHTFGMKLFKAFRHCKPISLNYTLKRCSRDFFQKCFLFLRQPLITLFRLFGYVELNDCCWGIFVFHLPTWPPSTRSGILYTCAFCENIYQDNGI